MQSSTMQTKAKSPLGRSNASDSDAPKSGSRSTVAATRRARMKQLTGRERTATLKIRPWSQLPGVVGYIVVDPEGLLTDRWGEPGLLEEERAAAFRVRARAGQIDGSYVLDSAGDKRLLSVLRKDGWFVHVWLEGKSDVGGILSVVGG